jgi:hypothetical protein
VEVKGIARHHTEARAKLAFSFGSCMKEGRLGFSNVPSSSI